jgi:hypothetical protein
MRFFNVSSDPLSAEDEAAAARLMALASRTKALRETESTMHVPPAETPAVREDEPLAEQDASAADEPEHEPESSEAPEQPEEER